MSYSGSGNTGGASSASSAGSAWRNNGGPQPHAFDPYLHPELFRGVLTRRFFAFLIDLVVLVGLFNGRRRLLHDILLGTVVINSSVRMPVPQPARNF